MLKPKKHLGQHFLIQPAIAQKIVQLLPTDDEQALIVEVGPGKGILTQYLIKRPNPIIALDLDPESIQYLQTRFHHHLTILHQDILSYNFPEKKYFLSEIYLTIFRLRFFFILLKITKKLILQW